MKHFLCKYVYELKSLQMSETAFIRALTLINNKASIDSRSFTSKLRAVKELLKWHNDHESQESDCHKTFLLGLAEICQTCLTLYPPACHVNAELINIHLIKVQICLLAALSNSSLSRYPVATYSPPFLLSSEALLLFGTKILLNIAYIVQTATWTPWRAELFFIYFLSNQWIQAELSAV